MSISFVCKQCGKKLKAPDSAAGKSSKCPGCGAAVTCPAPTSGPKPTPKATGAASAPKAGPTADDLFGDLDDGTPYGLIEPEPDPYAPPQSPTDQSAESEAGAVGKGKKRGKKRAELRQIAIAQKGIIFVILLQIIFYIATLLSPPPYKTYFALATLATGLPGIVFMFMLAMKLYSTVTGILLCILMFIPCISLIVLWRMKREGHQSAQRGWISRRLPGRASPSSRGIREVKGRTLSPPDSARALWHREVLLGSGIVLGLALLLEVHADERVSIRGLSWLSLPQICASRAGLGVNCPACGLTRSLILLARGNLEGSWRTTTWAGCSAGWSYFSSPTDGSHSASMSDHIFRAGSRFDWLRPAHPPAGQLDDGPGHWGLELSRSNRSSQLASWVLRPPPERARRNRAG